MYVAYLTFQCFSIAPLSRISSKPSQLIGAGHPIGIPTIEPKCHGSPQTRPVYSGIYSSRYFRVDADLQIGIGRRIGRVYNSLNLQDASLQTTTKHLSSFHHGELSVAVGTHAASTVSAWLGASEELSAELDAVDHR